MTNTRPWHTLSAAEQEQVWRQHNARQATPTQPPRRRGWSAAKTALVAVAAGVTLTATVAVGLAAGSAPPVEDAGYTGSAPAASPAYDTAPAPVYDVTDQSYLDTLESGTTGAYWSMSDDALIDAGWIICDTLDKYPSDGGVVGTVNGLTQGYSWTTDDAAFVTGVAISAYCPQHSELAG